MTNHERELSRFYAGKLLRCAKDARESGEATRADAMARAVAHCAICGEAHEKLNCKPRIGETEDECATGPAICNWCSSETWAEAEGWNSSRSREEYEALLLSQVADREASLCSHCGDSACEDDTHVSVAS